MFALDSRIIDPATLRKSFTNPMSFPATYCLADEFLAASEQARDKSERTRLRVLGVATELLDRSTTTQLLPAEVARRAGVSRTLMYHHFGDIAGLLAEIMGEFERRTVGTIRSAFVVTGRHGYGQLVGYLAWVLAVVLRNPGAFRLMHTPTDHMPGVKAAYGRLNFDLNRTLGEQLMPPSHMSVGADERLLMGYMVAEGFNTLLRDLFLYPNDHLPRLKTPDSLLNLVQLVAGHRHRLIHGVDPSPDEVRAVTENFDLSFFDDCFREHQPLALQAALAGRSAAGRKRHA